MSLKAEFEKFYKENFGEQELIFRVLYKFSIGIRFEIGRPNDNPNTSKVYTKNAVARATVIFNEVFEKNDIIYFIVNSFEDNPNDIAGDNISHVRPLIRHIQDECRFTFNSVEDEEFSCTRYIIKACVNDIKIESLFTEIAKDDFGGKIGLTGCVYLINPRNNVIFWFYDDRGLDLISNDKKNIENLYEKYNDWISGYDRERIEVVFKK